jgi:hypothetical protein
MTCLKIVTVAAALLVGGDRWQSGLPTGGKLPVIGWIMWTGSV